MALLTQKTINKILTFEGVTLHKGKIAKMKILPSAPNTGINFKRVDLKENNIIPANFYNVKKFSNNKNYKFFKIDINNDKKILKIFKNLFFIYPD